MEQRSRTCSAERVRALFDYDHATGVFTRRVAHGRHGRHPKGEVAGTVTSRGYIVICIDGRGYKAHRLAWLYVIGEWPERQIDHVDGDKSNNRFLNLRQATNAENHQNEWKARTNNRVGLLGVSKHGKSFRARLKIDGRTFRAPSRDTAEQAHADYLELKRRHHAFVASAA